MFQSFFFFINIEVINKKTSRNLLVDATLYGMGKSAGNTPIELMAMYMNENCEKKYNISQMLEAIETNILEIQTKTPWGYNLFFYIAASNKCHPSYISFLIEKHTLSVKSICEILSAIESEKKLLYDRSYIEKLYLDYQKNECDDQAANEKLKTLFAGKHILVLGPGQTIGSCVEEIKRYIKEQNVIIISINNIYPQYQTDYIFFTNSKRYSQITGRLNYNENKLIKIIATSNVTKTKGSFDFKINYTSLIDPDTDIPDNSLVMLLKLLISCEASVIALVGFDGYSEDGFNYCHSEMEYDFVKEKAVYLNNYVRTFLKTIPDTTKIKFITDSIYMKADMELL